MAKIIPIVTLALCYVFILEPTKATSTTLYKHLNDSSIVYYSYDSGEIKLTFVPDSDQDTAVVRKPDILVIGEILDSKDFSQTTIDTLDDDWFNQTNVQSYTYTVKVNRVVYGLCPKKILEITVTSSSSNEFKSRFSHISENGDSVYIATFIEPFCCGHLINKRIPGGEECILHFRKGDLKVVDYISSYSSDNLKKYLIKSGLDTEK